MVTPSLMSTNMKSHGANDVQTRFRWSHVASLWPWRRNRRPSPPSLNLNPTYGENPELAAFLAQAEALAERLKLRDPWTRAEITVLLQGAINAARTTYHAEGVDNLAVARATLERAQAVYYRDAQTKNRIIYVAGLALGVGFVVLVPLFLLWVIEALAAWTTKDSTPFYALLQEVVNAKPRQIAAPLLFFAGLGASSSVLSRLTTIDLKEE